MKLATSSRIVVLSIAAALLAVQCAVPAAALIVPTVGRPTGGETKSSAAAGDKHMVAVAPVVALRPAVTGIPGAVDLPASPVSGSLDFSSHKEDVYKVEIGDGKRIAFILKGHWGLNADVYLFGPEATQVDVNAALARTLGDEFPKSVVLDVPVGAAGTYYVAVRAWAGTGSYQLEWACVDSSNAADDDIPGIPIDASSSWSSVCDSLDWPADLDDVYAISVAEGERLEMELEGPAGADFDLRLFGPGTPTVRDAMPIFGSASPGSNESMMHDVLAGEGGTYYVSVHAVRGNGTYELSWRVVDVPAGAWESTQSAIPLSTPTGSRLDSLDRIADVNDMYSLYLPKGKRLTVTLDGDPGTDFDLYLHSPGGSTVVAFAADCTYPERLVADVVTSGTYYLEVRAFRGSGSYRLEWSITDTPAFTTAVRHAGPDRYATAIKISQATFPTGTVETAVLASGEAFPDALAASGLAGVYGSPVLLTRPTALPSGLLPELKRLGATKVVIVGGPGAVSNDTVAELARNGLLAERLFGMNRYETARRVAARIRYLTGQSFSKTAFVARGDDFADALAVAPCAYSLKAPVLLTPTTSLHAATRAAITENGISDAYVAGGKAVVSDIVKNEIESLIVRPVVRLHGTDRYATAAAVADYATRHYWLAETDVFVATGTSFPDALGGGAAAGKRSGAVLLTRPTVLPDATRKYLGARKGAIVTVSISGGPGAVSDSVKAAIEGLLR